MKILLTNDDGIYARGLWALYDVFSKENEVFVVAPDRERSAVSHGITLNEPLRVFQVKVDTQRIGFAINGTPADCVKLSLLELLDEKPDLVVSGINPGSNAGVSVNYSGTVAAAKEASLYGVDAIAVSMQGYEIRHVKDAARFTLSLAREVFEKKLPFGTILNVNFPDIPIEKTRGVRMSRLGIQKLDDYYEKKSDPRNKEYYWLGSDTRVFGNGSEYDGDALYNDFISITPVKCDTTDNKMFRELENWEVIKGNEKGYKSGE